MKRQLAAAVAVLALFGCQQDKSSVEQAREAEEIQFTSAEVLDCAGPQEPASRIVCADAGLRALDRRIAELWAEASTVSGRPATLARRRADWLETRAAGERDWETNATRPRTLEELQVLYGDFAADLEEEVRIARAIPSATALSALGGGCIGQALNGCHAPSAGFLTGPGGERLAWQIQQGSTERNGVSTGVILFAIQGSELHPVGWSFEAVAFDAPEIFAHDGAVYVSVEGRTAGSGSGNADLLMRLDGDRWSEIEAEGWQAGLVSQLPDGLTVSRGVDYDWPEMVARTALWREADALCCPSGGRATAQLTVRGRAVALSEVDVREAG